MFIDDHRDHLGVEAICKVLPIAPSTYYHHKAIELDPVNPVWFIPLWNASTILPEIPNIEGRIVEAFGDRANRV